jgi:hypothetical protein
MQEPERKAVNVEDALHAVFTCHGIASRSDYPYGLICDLVSWAVAMCRQSQSAELKAQAVRLSQLEARIKELEKDK